MGSGISNNVYSMVLWQFKRAVGPWLSYASYSDHFWNNQDISNSYFSWHSVLSYFKCCHPNLIFIRSAALQYHVENCYVCWFGRLNQFTVITKQREVTQAQIRWLLRSTAWVCFELVVLYNHSVIGCGNFAFYFIFISFLSIYTSLVCYFLQRWVVKETDFSRPISWLPKISFSWRLFGNLHHW